ncbi:uncharacterized protein ABDE67_014796 [Symphorus nematophorus]
MAHCGDLAVGCKKTLKTPFRSLFASPITDALQHLDNPVITSSCPQDSVQSSCPALQSADCDLLKNVLEPDKASDSSYRSLFAAPLPCVQSQTDSQQSVQAVDNTSHSSESKQRAPKLETPLQCKVRTDVSPNAKVGKYSSTEHISPPTKQLVDPVCSLVSDLHCEASSNTTPRSNSLTTSHTCQHLPDISSHKGSAVGAKANSVLKTLFVCLSPYQQDGEQEDSIQISVPSESEKDKSSTGCVFAKQQKKSGKKGGRKKKLKTQESHRQSIEKTVAADTGEHRPSLQTPQISLEATGGSTMSSPRMTESQVRDSDTPILPSKPVTQDPTRPAPKHTSEEVKWEKGNVAAKPLKDLFKTLDTAVFHFGH